MAFTLWFGVLAFTLVYVYLLDRRYRLVALDEEREEREVEPRSRSASRLTRAPRPRRRSEQERHDELRGVRHHRVGRSPAPSIGGYWLWIVRRTRRAEASWQPPREAEVE